MRQPYLLPQFLALFLVGLLSHCSSPEPSPPKVLSEAEKRLPENALYGLEIAEGLEASLFASEPMLLNPTNIDVDAKGRVWVCEAFNYRNHLNPDNPLREAGDRILILEDTDKDGQADKTTVFYQGPDINSALGIAVIGNQVIVSVSPHVFVFTDEDGDDVPEKKEILFSGIGGEQHDHGMHAFLFGPDGKWYFNFGNAGDQLLHANGKPVLDQLGRPIKTDGKPYRQGMVFRSDAGGANVEVLGHNFRNNYEVTVDAFGTLWQSDNDDDGNQGTRINYVMEHGNFGYKDQQSGAGWRAIRTGMEPTIPEQHWHLNDPGVVPNLIQTGAGSPTGILLYEGDLLPEVFHNQIIHCDAGPNVVRSYPVQPKGAGYEARVVNLMKGVADNWFRPSDVCVAPDGSLFIADWYDPGVGGHQMGDTARGRIYRLAPPNTPYQVPEYDFTTPAGAAEALHSPNLAIRALAWQSLYELGNEAEADLLNIWQGADSRMRARALWLLAKLPGKGEIYLSQAMQDANPDIRITALRSARQNEMLPLLVLHDMAQDSSVQVRREVALALRFEEGAEADQIWVKLAEEAPVGDRWYLEALGIGADLYAADRFAAWQESVGDTWNSPIGQDIVWRIKTPAAIPLLGNLIQQTQQAQSASRFFRALDFYPPQLTHSTLLSLIDGQHPQQEQITYYAIKGMETTRIMKSARIRRTLDGLLNSLYETNSTAYLDLVEDLKLKTENERLFELAMAYPAEEMGQRATRLLRENDGLDLFKDALRDDDPTVLMAALTSLGSVSNDQSIDLLQTFATNDTHPMHLRKAAIQHMGNGWQGESRLEEWLVTEPELPEELLIAGATRLLGANRERIRQTASELLQLDEAEDLPPIHELIGMTGDITAGQQLFSTYCSACHQVQGAGIDFGPNLSEIGSKLSKEALFGSIINPSAGVSFGYEGYLVKTKDGQIYLGFLSSQTENEVTLRVAGGNNIPLQRSQIESMEIQDQSLMTAGLHNIMEPAELVSLVAYLASLKKKEEFAAQ